MPKKEVTLLNTNMPQISVIIPIYNAEKYIARCLQSVLENTYQNLEVLCINDGSTDKSEEVLHDIASKDSRIKVLNQSNQGVSIARNHGLDVATGEYVAFIDADDWVHKQYFECLLNACLKTGAAIAMCKFIAINDENCRDTIIDLDPQIEIYSVEKCFKTSYVKTYVWGKMINREIVRKIRFKKGLKFGEDTFFMLRLLCENPQINLCFMDSMLYYYYQHDGPRGSFAPSDAYLSMVDALLEYTKEINDFKSLSAMLMKEEVVKKLLRYRYEARIERKFKDARHNFQVRFLSLKPAIMLFPFKKRIIYRTLALFPSLYRVLLILRDKTVLDWEKQKSKMFINTVNDVES